ncbi:NYN domain-containing protein [Candidatus Gracilibacteria bacterium]|nr:NYN domain-containing protein [Candidatus Gracilibacteria bacterium]
MFTPKTKKIAEIAKEHTKVIKELKKLLDGNVYMYIDYANVRPWSERLKWHIDLRRLKQFLDSFDNIEDVKFYSGTLEGDEKSEQEIQDIKSCKYNLVTKPVKVMKFSIDTTSIASMGDRSLLAQFIHGSLLRKYNGETIEYLNKRFDDMNRLGEGFIENRKCNFDVEIGVDMLLDAEKGKFHTCVLWSGDSDFYDPIKRLLESSKKAILFATARRISRELAGLRREGLIIFDIKKIRNLICWKREIVGIAKEPSITEDSKP